MSDRHDTACRTADQLLRVCRADEPQVRRRHRFQNKRLSRRSKGMRFVGLVVLAAPGRYPTSKFRAVEIRKTQDSVCRQSQFAHRVAAVVGDGCQFQGTGVEKTFYRQVVARLDFQMNRVSGSQPMALRMRRRRKAGEASSRRLVADIVKRIKNCRTEHFEHFRQM